MRIALEGRPVVLLGDDNEIGRAVSAALVACGASVATAGDAYALIQVSAGVAGKVDAGEVERFALGAQARARSRHSRRPSRR